MTASTQTPEAGTIDQASGEGAAASRVRAISMRFEVTVLGVSHVDRAKAFYKGLGWRLDADFVPAEDYRIVQFTPPGSPASIQFGKGLTTTAHAVGPRTATHGAPSIG